MNHHVPKSSGVAASCVLLNLASIIKYPQAVLEFMQFDLQRALLQSYKSALTSAGSFMKHALTNSFILGLAALFSVSAMADPSRELAALLRDSSDWTAPKAFAFTQTKNGSLKLMAMRNYTFGVGGDGITAQVIISLDKPAPPPPSQGEGQGTQPNKPNLTVQGFPGYYEEVGPIHRITFSLCNSTEYFCAFMASGSASKEQLLSLVKHFSLGDVGTIAARAFR